MLWTDLNPAGLTEDPRPPTESSQNTDRHLHLKERPETRWSHVRLRGEQRGGRVSRGDDEGTRDRYSRGVTPQNKAEQGRGCD